MNRSLKRLAVGLALFALLIGLTAACSAPPPRTLVRPSRMIAPGVYWEDSVRDGYRYR